MDIFTLRLFLSRSFQSAVGSNIIFYIFLKLNSHQTVGSLARIRKIIIYVKEEKLLKVKWLTES